jgi:hypothetical protein
MTSDAPSDEDVRSIARFEISTGLDARNRLMDEHAAAFRWLTASLFAANGGALIALVGSEDVPAYARMWAGLWFTTGICFSLLAAWFNQRVIQKLIDPLTRMIAFWGGVAHGMEVDQESHANLIAALKESTKRSWPVQVCGWIAVAVFLFGMLAAGTGFWSAAKSQTSQHIHSPSVK